jgi:O-antigen/teichoic acid export membrane protein
MSRTRRFLGGLSFGYINMALVTLTGLWLTPFLLARIGQQDYGLWLLSAQVLIYLSLMDFGVIALLPRETAYALGARAKDETNNRIPQVIGETARLVLWQTPLVALAVVIVWLMLPPGWVALREPLALVLIVFVLTFPLRIFQAALTGLQDLGFLGKLQVANWFISTVLTISLVLAGRGLFALAAGWGITQIVSAIVCLVRLKRKFPSAFPVQLPSLSLAQTRARLASGGWVMISQLAQILINGTDLIIIGKLLGPFAVVPYACTSKLITVLAHQPQMIMHAAGPALSEMKASESRARLFEVCTALTQAMLMLSGFVACLVLVVNHGFVNWWVGTGQFGGELLTVLLVINMLCMHWNITAVYTVFCFGYERRLCLLNLIDGFVTISGALILIRWLGPLGMPIGSLIGTLFVSLPANLTVLARETDASVIGLLKPLLPWLWRFILLASAAFFSARYWQPNSFIKLAIASTITAIIYGLVMLPLALRAPLGNYLRPRLQTFLGRFGSKIFRAPLAPDTEV